MSTPPPQSRKPSGSPSPYARKRTKQEREFDLVDIARLHLQRKTQREIVEWIAANRRYRISRTTLVTDLKEVQRRWTERACGFIAERRAEEVARIDAVERECWGAWERSQRENAKRRKDADLSGTGAKPTRASQITQERDGDPRHLDGVMECVRERCKLLGLHAPEKTEVTGPGGKPEGKVIIYLPDNQRGAPIPDEEETLSKLTKEELGQLEGMVDRVNAAEESGKAGAQPTE